MHGPTDGVFFFLACRSAALQQGWLVHLPSMFGYTCTAGLHTTNRLRVKGFTPRSDLVAATRAIFLLGTERADKTRRAVHACSVSGATAEQTIAGSASLHLLR